MSEELGDFRGARKITSLSCYPLEYHKNEAELRNELVERGKKFVGLSGVHYKSHQGMAYCKKKKAVIKVNINGRIMVDPQIHRRINPNYPISLVRPKDHDILSDIEDDSSDAGCGCNSDDSDNPDAVLEPVEGVKFVTKAVRGKNGKIELIKIPKLKDDEAGPKEKLDHVPSKDDQATTTTDETDDKENADKTPPEFTDEEYLIASPVVLGFAFAEKLWLEFTVSGVKDIQWNENAYQSLVLEPKTKDIVKVCRTLILSASISSSRISARYDTDRGIIIGIG
jgi:hypothetical protein